MLRRCAVRLSSGAVSLFQREIADKSDLRSCYRLILRREPDGEGWKSWSKQIRRGMSVDSLVDAFMNSQEVANRELTKGRRKVELDGFVIWVDSRDMDIGGEIVERKTYEPHVTAAIRRELKDGSVFVDVGANIGWHTLNASRRVGTSGKVIAFEPGRSNLQLLYHNIVSNRLRNAEVFPFAVSSERRLLQFMSGISNAAVKEIPEDADSCEYVQAVTLDEILRDEKRIDVIKMDIEGHEPEALKGMMATMRKHKPVLVSEFNPDGIRELSRIEPEEYLSAILGLGYSISVIELGEKELPMKDEKAVMTYWNDFRRTHEESYGNIDIIARPARL